MVMIFVRANLDSCTVEPICEGGGGQKVVTSLKLYKSYTLNTDPDYVTINIAAAYV